MPTSIEFYVDEALISEEDEWQEENYAAGFQWLVWTTQDGYRVRIKDMDTRHLFNAMKMCFNHLAAEHGGEPVWFTKVWNGSRAMAKGRPYVLARYVVAMLRELDHRTDLPEAYKQPYALIRAQVIAEPRRLNCGEI